MADYVTIESDTIRVYVQDGDDSVVSVQESPSPVTITQPSSSPVTVTEADNNVSVYEGLPLTGGEGGDKNYVQSFTAQTLVSVTHNLGKKPSVSIYDSAGDEVVGDVEYINNNQLTVTFSSSFTGTLILN